MATQTIDYNINVNAGGSLRTIQDIENELNELNQEIKDVGVGSKAFEKAAGNIQKLEKELRNSQSAVEGFTLDKKLEAADGAIKIVAGSVAGTVVSVAGVETVVVGVSGSVVGVAGVVTGVIGSGPGLS